MFLEESATLGEMTPEQVRTDAFRQVSTMGLEYGDDRIAPPLHRKPPCRAARHRLVCRTGSRTTNTRSGQRRQSTTPWTDAPATRFGIARRRGGSMSTRNDAFLLSRE